MSAPTNGPVAGNIGPTADELLPSRELTATGENMDAAAAGVASQYPAMPPEVLRLLIGAFDSGFRAGVTQTLDALTPDQQEEIRAQILDARRRKERQP